MSKTVEVTGFRLIRRLIVNSDGYMSVISKSELTDLLEIVLAFRRYFIRVRKCNIEGVMGKFGGSDIFEHVKQQRGAAEPTTVGKIPGFVVRCMCTVTRY